jgi:hypothetical protein
VLGGGATTILCYDLWEKKKNRGFGVKSQKKEKRRFFFS